MDYYPRRYSPGLGGYSDYPPIQPAALSYGGTGGYLPPSRPVYVVDVPDNPPPVQVAQPQARVVSIAVKKQTGNYIVNKKYKWYGYFLCLLAIASLAVEIANVIITYQNISSCSASSIPLTLTWIAPGIWGSIPVFITGVLAIHVAGRNSDKVRAFAFFAAMSALIFTPAMIAISIAEIFMYSGYSCYGQSYNLNNSGTLGSLKFILPLVVAVLAGIEFYLTLMITTVFCCCMKPGMGNINTAGTTVSAAPAAAAAAVAPPPQQVVVAPPPPVQSVYAPVDQTYVRPYYSPVYRPAISRGFGISPGYGLQGAMSPYSMYGANPTMASFMTPAPNPAYQIYG